MAGHGTGARQTGPVRRAVAAGLLVGGLAIAALARWDRPRSPAGPEFVAAWGRRLTGTYAVVDRIDRHLLNGRSLVSEVRLAQRPPDRLRVGAEGVDGRVNGRLLGCVAVPGADIQWRDGGSAPPYQQDVDRQVRLLRRLVIGPRRAYDVHRVGDGCYRLELRARILAPPYGEDATFCFDEATGAPLRSTVRRAEGTDVHRTI